MASTALPNAGSKTTDPQAAELAALTDAIGAISKRLDALTRGRKNGASDDGGNGDAATGEEGVSYSGETNEEEKGHSTIGTGEDTSFDGTRARQLASDSARADGRRRRADDVASEEERIAEMKAGIDHAYQSVRGSYAPLSHAGELWREYQLRSLRPLKHYSDDWRDVDLSKLADDALKLADRTIRADCVRVGNDPRLMGEFMPPGGGLREIKRRDRSGREISEFVGPVSAMLEPFRAYTARVKRFNRHPDRDY